MEILTFEPYYKSVVWGGERIARFKGIASQGRDIGESWELSPMPGHESVATSDGDLHGLTLNEIVGRDPLELMGAAVVRKYGNQFPLLVKIIDSSQDLSVQVHPDDGLARRLHGCLGKTEMWLSLDPAPGAYLYAGFDIPLHPDELDACLQEGSILSVLRKFYPCRGDVYFLPAGRIHAIGAGNLVLEIQEASDITYRIYDYGRGRELHLAQARQALDYGDDRARAAHVEAVAGRECDVLNHPFFHITLIGVDGEHTLDLGKRDSFTILFVSHGAVTVTDAEGKKTELPQGHTALIPAAMPSVALQGVAEVVTCYIPA